MLPKVEGRPKGPPFAVFFDTMRHFSDNFWILSKVTPLNFLKFSVCKKTFNKPKGSLSEFFGNMRLFLPNTFFWKKIFFQFFQLLFLEYFWALDMKPTWAVPGLLFLESLLYIQLYQPLSRLKSFGGLLRYWSCSGQHVGQRLERLQSFQL